MSNVDSLLKQAINASLQQTEASKGLSDEVRQKMGLIDTRVDQKLSDVEAWKDSVKADQLDGVARYVQTIDLTGLPTDYYFPVWWEMKSNEHGGCNIQISRHYSRDHELAPFGEDIAHIAGLLVQLEGCGTAWGGDSRYLQIKRLLQTYRETVRKISHQFACIARPVDGSKPLYGGAIAGKPANCYRRSGCYLRGGLNYIVVKNWKGEIHFSKELGEEKVAEWASHEFEIKWVAKAYQSDDPFLGERYLDCETAYEHTNNQLFAPRV